MLTKANDGTLAEVTIPRKPADWDEFGSVAQFWFPVYRKSDRKHIGDVQKTLDYYTGATIWTAYTPTHYAIRRGTEYRTRRAAVAALVNDNLPTA